MKCAKVFLIFVLLLPAFLLAQTPDKFPTSLHGTRQGKFTWYGSANGGMESLTGIPMSQLGCHRCHPGTYADGSAVDPATYQPGCNDCHNFTQGTAVADDICMKCHSRQKTERSLGYQDVHVLKGFKCTSCHTKKEMHGDGTSYASMLEAGATEVSCEKCHTTVSSNTSHSIHQTKVQCTACHVKSVISCYNCHIESYVEGGIRRHYGPQRDFIFLVNRQGVNKAYPASFQTAAYNGKTFLAIAPFTPHTVVKQGRACAECHSNAAIKEYDQTGKITVTRWDTTQKKIISPTGVIPVTSDWQQAIQVDFLNYTGDPKSATTDPTKWVFLKSTADGKQMLYANPLTADQLARLRTPMGVASDFSTSLHATRTGKAWWYSKDNGGFETLTNIPMSSLACQKCHAATYANGQPVDNATYTPGCNDCHDFTQGTTVKQATCLGCHSRQNAEINLSASNPIFKDVHRDKGFTCTSCHTKEEMHGDGNVYNSMHDPGAFQVNCEKCHTQLPSNTAHSVHGTTISCSACHSQTVSSCYNCHFETEVQADKKRYYGPPPINGFVLLVNKRGKVTTASFQSLAYAGKTFYAIGPFHGHTITDKGRDCKDCHNNQNVRDYNQTGKINVARWDTTSKKIVNTKGVIPVPPDWKQALQLDFVNYTGNVTDATSPLDPTKWVFIKSGADLSQILYAEPLTAAQMQKLAIPISVKEKSTTRPENFELMQNYPNPFNPGTWFEFHLAKPTVVTLKIYNVLGVEVKTLLLNEKMDAGVHKVEWRADDLAGGIYVCRLETPEFTQSRKLTLIK
ncbi:MAG: T9SS type A sorting domain-containing protein [candidate division KSB1 bacterium]|nr:T9SS type A sorting domain-containing protein [candidate division KSB1 bacterium]MDZ7304373.1 T9SS type A sorting domain-containing protein [candidate division KSB1 bacterium]MDZ7313522.1 T9SS type A sorting domain-containing protein [candidate division KSB1 bacterium]